MIDERDKNLSEKEKRIYDQIKQKKEEEEIDDEYGIRETFHYKGVFVNDLKAYAKNKKLIRIGSFIHKNVVGRVVMADATQVVIKKSIDGKLLKLTQTSIKYIEEV